MTRSDRSQPKPYAAPILKLLKGAISYDQDPKNWELLLTHEKNIRSHFSDIGLELYLEKIDGYAYLRQTNDEESESEEDLLQLPKLTVRRSFNKKETLLLVILREALLELEDNHPENPPILKRSEIHEKLHPFFPTSGNEVERIRELDRIIQRVSDYGFLRDLKNEHYRIERIIKSKLTVDELKSIRDKFQSVGVMDESISSDPDRG
ncbi:MAG: DUF4194 domain-containing protein [Leptospira sp.]|nr:DUF4194 domain-containing protein [Leptospira sp.]